MVIDRGPAGCPVARLKPGGWGAVVAEEVQMTWLTWKEMGFSGAHALQEGSPRSIPTPTVTEPAIRNSFLLLAGECRLQLTQCGGHSHVSANT